MKYISTLILTLLSWVLCYSQTLTHKYSKKDHSIIRKNSKGLSLEVGDLKTVEKNSKTSWKVKTILTNHSRDTVLYFITADCEAANFMAMAMVDNISLFADFEPCDVNKQTVIVLPPKGKRTVDVLFNSQRPVTSSFKFIVFLHLAKAKNKDERIPHDDLMLMKDRVIFLQSKQVKVQMPGNKDTSK